MIEKDRALPLIKQSRGLHDPPILAQRDADWERVRPLVEAMELLLGCRWVMDTASVTKDNAEVALARFEGKP